MSELAQELMEPDGYLQPKRYKITFQCDRCAHQWQKVVTRLDGKDPPCPRKACREAAVEEEINRRAENLARMVAEGRGPASIGGNTMNRAIDLTADITMAGYGLTDLKDNLREGDTMAPALPAPLQRQADGFFNGAGLADAVGGGRAGGGMARRMTQMGQRALRGSYRSTAVSIADVDPRGPNEPALRMVGKEKIGTEKA
jgi:hypothetical protein